MALRHHFKVKNLRSCGCFLVLFGWSFSCLLSPCVSDRRLARCMSTPLSLFCLVCSVNNPRPWCRGQEIPHRAKVFSAMRQGGFICQWYRLLAQSSAANECLLVRTLHFWVGTTAFISGPFEAEVSSWLSWYGVTLVSLTDCRWWFDSPLVRE